MLLRKIGLFFYKSGKDGLLINLIKMITLFSAFFVLIIVFRFEKETFSINFSILSFLLYIPLLVSLLFFFLWISGYVYSKEKRNYLITLYRAILLKKEVDKDETNILLWLDVVIEETEENKDGDNLIVWIATYHAFKKAEKEYSKHLDIFFGLIGREYFIKNNNNRSSPAGIRIESTSIRGYILNELDTELTNNALRWTGLVEKINEVQKRKNIHKQALQKIYESV